MTENGLDDYDQLTAGEGYDDGQLTRGDLDRLKWPLDNEPDDWANDEARALVSADLALEEHLDSELARAEREREGEPEPWRQRRRR